MPSLNIIGYGGHGRVIADIALSGGHFDSVQFFDDAWPDLTVNPYYPLYGAVADLTPSDGAVVIAIGNNRTRLKIYSALKQRGFVLPALIHPSAVIGRHVHIGEGTVVMPGAVVNCGSRIGDVCIINSNATIEHDCVLADGVHISPGVALAGAVNIGHASWIGIGSSVKQCIHIGHSATVGAGSVVIRDVENLDIVVGVPARSIK